MSGEQNCRVSTGTTLLEEMPEGEPLKVRMQMRLRFLDAEKGVIAPPFFDKQLKFERLQREVDRGSPSRGWLRQSHAGLHQSAVAARE